MLPLGMKHQYYKHHQKSGKTCVRNGYIYILVLLWLYLYWWVEWCAHCRLRSCCFTGYHSLCSIEIQMYTCYKFDCRLSNRLLSDTAAVLPRLTLTQSADAGVSMRVSMGVSSPLYYDHWSIIYEWDEVLTGLVCVNLVTLIPQPLNLQLEANPTIYPHILQALCFTTW